MLRLGALSWAFDGIRRVPGAQRHNSALALEAVSVDGQVPAKPNFQGEKSGTHHAVQVPHSSPKENTEQRMRTCDCEAAYAVQDSAAGAHMQAATPNRA
jgi:hypothetical protein